MEIQFLGEKYLTSDLIKKRRNIIKKLYKEKTITVEKKILMLSGSTIGELSEQLKMFCLAKGVELNIIQGDFGRYYEDAVFGNSNLEEQYDFIYVHVTARNLEYIPEPFEKKEDVDKKITKEIAKFNNVINSLIKKYNCPIIFNNFELLPYRVMGNCDAWDYSGAINYIQQINCFINSKARDEKNFYINDINYLSSYFGLKRWSDFSVWYRYKYAMSLEAIPIVAQNISAILFSLLGMNKKCMILDLDNTLWGGIIGDDGPGNVVIGNDTAKGEAYIEFQQYVKNIKRTGILLSIVSKNEEEIARKGFDRQEMKISIDDISSFIANWEPKSKNIELTASKLNLGKDSFVFIDDSQMERDEVYCNQSDVSIPIITDVSNYIHEIEECRLFEITNYTEEDKVRSNYYLQNEKREKESQNYSNYEEYLESLNMKWEFKDFQENSYERIVQLINKTNQFNLTTLRMNMSEVIERASCPERYICLEGRMEDKFGDNGLITVLIGKVNGEIFEIENWLMSCRVFRRNGEYKLFDYLISRCREYNIKIIRGKYIPTSKNSIVKDFYFTLKFELVKENENGTREFELKI